MTLTAAIKRAFRVRKVRGKRKPRVSGAPENEPIPIEQDDDLAGVLVTGCQTNLRTKKDRDAFAGIVKAAAKMLRAEGAPESEPIVELPEGEDEAGIQKARKKR